MLGRRPSAKAAVTSITEATMSHGPIRTSPPSARGLAGARARHRRHAAGSRGASDACGDGQHRGRTGHRAQQSEYPAEEQTARLRESPAWARQVPDRLVMGGIKTPSGR
jgi:hypothetical protein